jgi:hypothetical protein
VTLVLETASKLCRTHVTKTGKRIVLSRRETSIDLPQGTESVTTAKA